MVRRDSVSTSSWSRCRRFEEFKAIIRDIQASAHYSAPHVFKVFGPGNQAPLSFQMAGWDVTMGFPNKCGIGTLLSELDRRVLEFGGRL